MSVRERSTTLFVDAFVLSVGPLGENTFAKIFMEMEEEIEKDP